VTWGGWRRSRKWGRAAGSWRRENIHQFMRKKKATSVPHASSPRGRRHRLLCCCRRLPRCSGAAGEPATPACSDSSAGASGMLGAGCGSRGAGLSRWRNRAELEELCGLVGYSDPAIAAAISLSGGCDCEVNFVYVVRHERSLQIGEEGGVEAVFKKPVDIKKFVYFDSVSLQKKLVEFDKIQ
jgi:hypothetical protein